LPARVIADYGAEYLVDDDGAILRAVARRTDPTQPVVGDWVLLDGSSIAKVMPRTTVFSRRAAGDENREQVLAANVDVVFVVAAATDVNPRRLERYLTIAWQSGAVPVVVVTKADLAPDLDLPAVAAQVVVTSSVTGDGLHAISEALLRDRTGVLLGPSGAGKSTLINALLGRDAMRTRAVHEGSGEGRHMTSHRQLLRLPGGGSIIDTPGLREAQLWVSQGDVLGEIFADIQELALQCRFRDCAHETEPGCAVKDAIDPDRLRSYRKLQRELLAIARKSDARLRIDERRQWKNIAVANRARERYLRG
jgi:ribosome biogenesis GTPase